MQHILKNISNFSFNYTEESRIKEAKPATYFKRCFYHPGTEIMEIN